MFNRPLQPIHNKSRPDQPINFGFKNQWLAIKSKDIENIIKALRLPKVRACNWKEGVHFGYTKGVFITPEINGWTLVLGVDILDLESNGTQAFLKRISREFEECQLFLTQRNTEYHFWGLARQGKIKRLYSYFGEEGNLIIRGKATAIEQSLNLVKTISNSNNENITGNIPNEDTVMLIAENWSVNPSKIENYANVSGLGFIGKWSLLNQNLNCPFNC